MLPKMNLVILQNVLQIGIVQRTMVLNWHIECKGTHYSAHPLNLSRFESYLVTPSYIPVSILRKSISGRHRPVRVADGPMTARCRFT